MSNKVSTAEVLTLHELLKFETNALPKMKAVNALIEDPELKTMAVSGVQACEGRIKGLQKFIDDHDIRRSGVH